MGMRTSVVGKGECGRDRRRHAYAAGGHNFKKDRRATENYPFPGDLHRFTGKNYGFLSQLHRVPGKNYGFPAKNYGLPGQLHRVISKNYGFPCQLHRFMSMIHGFTGELHGFPSDPHGHQGKNHYFLPSSGHSPQNCSTPSLCALSQGWRELNCPTFPAWLESIPPPA